MKSKITRIVFTQTKNLGNYENCRVEAEAIVEEEDNPNAVMKRLKQWVANQANEGPYDE